jgi:hypothetical protein
MTSNDSGTLYTLGDRGQTINGSTNDVRGREVKDKNSNSIGKVTDLLIDDREQKVRFRTRRTPRLRQNENPDTSRRDHKDHPERSTP